MDPDFVGGNLEVAALGVGEPDRFFGVVELDLEPRGCEQRVAADRRAFHPRVRRTLDSIQPAEHHPLARIAVREEHQHVVADVGQRHQALAGAGPGTEHAQPFGLEVGIGREGYLDASFVVGVVDAGHHAGRGHRVLRPRPGGWRCGPDLGDVPALLVDGVRHFGQDIAAGDGIGHAFDLDPRAGAKPRIPLRDGGKGNLSGGAEIEFRLGKPLSMLVVLGRLVRELARPVAANLAGCDLGADRPTAASRADLAAMRLVAQRIPSDGLDRPACRVTVDFHPDLEERVAQDESDRVAHALQRGQVKRLIPERGVQAASGRHIGEQLEVGLAMLDDLVVRRPRMVGMDEDADVLDQLFGEARRRNLDVCPNALAFSEPMQDVVAADPHLPPVARVIDLLDRRGLTAEQRAGQALDRYLEVAPWAKPGGGRQRPGCLAKGELALRR